jgi:hypothetical protein
MTLEEVKDKINELERRLDADHYDHDKHAFVPATGSTREWLLSSIQTYKEMLPQARHNDKVRAFGWRSVERNA